MLSRILSLLFLLWFFGFVLFALTLPKPYGPGESDAVVVLTGSRGRIEHGLDVLRKGWASRMFVSGVDRDVRRREFQVEYKVPKRLMKCCVTLGYRSTDTRSNAQEVEAWVSENHIKTLRFVTADWHMRRAAMELRRRLPDDVEIQLDPVPSRVPLRGLFLEYHKLLARFAAPVWERWA